MRNDRLVWTEEMKNTLLRYWQAGMDHTDIADRMGLKMEQISGALQRCRRGEWGGDYAVMYKSKASSTLEATIAEANARGMTYGQLQTERRLAAEQTNAVEAVEAEESDVTGDIQIVEPIDMLKAIDTLTRCAITQNSKITAISAVEGQFADVAFVCCGSTYVLSLRREDQE